MGCASTTPMLVHAAEGQGNGQVLQAIETGAGQMVEKASQEVEKIVNTAKDELGKALSEIAANDAEENMPAADDAPATEEKPEEKMNEEDVARAVTPAVDEETTSAPQEEITQALAELQESLPDAPATDVIPENTDMMPENTDVMPENTDVVPDAEGKQMEETMKPDDATEETKIEDEKPGEQTEVVITTEEMSSNDLVASILQEAIQEEGEGLLEVPTAVPSAPSVASGHEDDSDSSDVDFNMTLEDMEILEAQLRALSSPPPISSTDDDEMLCLSVPPTLNELDNLESNVTDEIMSKTEDMMNKSEDIMPKTEDMTTKANDLTDNIEIMMNSDEIFIETMKKEEESDTNSIGSVIMVNPDTKS